LNLSLNFADPQLPEGGKTDPALADRHPLIRRDSSL
jgi:hypothetical protein